MLRDSQSGDVVASWCRVILRADHIRRDRQIPRRTGSYDKGPIRGDPSLVCGFLVVALLLLVISAVYLHVFYGYWLDLDARRRAEGLAETYPALFTIDRRVARLLTALILYWIVPLVLATIAWKASARLEWALPCAVVTGLVTTALAVLRATRRAGSKWRYKQLVLPGLLYVLMIIAPLLLGIRALESPAIRHRLERPVNLFRADLKDAWLV